MKQEENPWSKGIVLICTKCSKSISTKSLKEDGNTADNLKMYLKKSFKDSGDGGKVRVVTSSCLDLCIDETQAVTYCGVDGITETFAIHPEEDREKILQYLRNKISE
ncbi:(2Fe-2S) ferredoxin domain-containing protein [Bdellovibrio reynosensis]|uniref:(2Fe-2S) ferredoxin domain-containing protein n=1 Tax=Bdellovibrio reynosensis TaxID=2835041 RepID=A0ABY4C8V0_9BACT|nr:(2Fe-2S) ferredoxin domain-containing protein [Bdellovibrio reynosensis]UOE99907.1 (2Fe-2S) ferredoxin domain-containing protein [Bdellovibrio reynosensis]